MQLFDYFYLASHLIITLFLYAFVLKRESKSQRANENYRDLMMEFKKFNVEQNYQLENLSTNLRKELYEITDKRQPLRNNSKFSESFSYFDITTLQDKDFEKIPATRYLQIEIYIDAESQNEIKRLENQFYEFVNNIGFTIEHEVFERTGSLWKKLFAKSKKLMSSPEVQTIIAQAEHSLRLKHIEKIQSEVDKNQAEAIAALLKGAESSTHIAFRVGSLVAIKTLDITGNSVTYGATLTPNEMIDIQKNPTLMRSPKKLMRYLDGDAGILEN